MPWIHKDCSGEIHAEIDKSHVALDEYGCPELTEQDYFFICKKCSYTNSPFDEDLENFADWEDD